MGGGGKAPCLENPLKVCGDALTLLPVFVCVCVCLSFSAGLPICNGYQTFCQKADCQARKKKRKGANSSFSSPSLPLSLHFTLLTALPAAQSIYFLLSSSLKFVFSLKQRHGYFGHYHLLSLYGPTPSFPSI